MVKENTILSHLLPLAIYPLHSFKNVLNKFLLTTIPVNKLTNIPSDSVIANPLTGPDVCKNEKSKGFANTKAVTKVAIFASLIESQARPKDTSSASEKGRCIFSSLNRSNIRIFASTAIPTESKNPAIPGSVKTTGISL